MLRILLFFNLAFLVLVSNGNETSHEEDPVIRLNFFYSNAFAQIVTNISSKEERADVACRAAYGYFWFSSYTGTCKSCESECSDNSSNTKTLCLQECQSFLLYQMQRKEYLDLQNKYENQQILIAENKSNQLLFTIIFGILAVVAIMISIISLVIVYRNQNSDKERIPVTGQPLHDIDTDP